MLKFIATLAVLSMLSIPAHADTVQTELTACTNADAIETYTRGIYLEHKTMADMMPVLNKDKTVCSLTLRAFDLVKVVKTIDFGTTTYTLVEISVVAEGQRLASNMVAWFPSHETLYAMYYTPRKGSDA